MIWYSYLNSDKTKGVMDREIVFFDNNSFKKRTEFLDDFLHLKKVSYQEY